ncbi:hypothetical protein P7H22_10930 [Paenibacillus larvae]|nr:binary toxin-like calcium binding domain-containing protein [Paenibacillus larvae]MDT2240751.1 hypothetical protein [Paenibacillus larvae]
MAEQEELLQLDVDYTLNQQETKEIEVETFSIPEIISFENLPMGTDSKTEENKQPMLDTDDDGIYDDWEVNGYYIKPFGSLLGLKRGRKRRKRIN